MYAKTQREWASELGALGTHLGAHIGTLRTELLEHTLEACVDGAHAVVNPSVGPARTLRCTALSV